MKPPRLLPLAIVAALASLSPLPLRADPAPTAGEAGEAGETLEGEGAKGSGEGSGEGWCAPELEALSTGACFAVPKKHAEGPKTLVVFLHGVVKPDSGWQHNQQRAAKRAALTHGFSVMMPHGRRGNGPKGMEDWWTWPTGAAHAQVEAEVIAEWQKGREELEAKTGETFDRVWLFGFSNGAYFATSLALRARLSGESPLRADGFAVFAGGDGAPYLEKAARSQKTRAPLFVGWGGKDKAHRDQERLARMLSRLGWPSLGEGAPKAGHTMVDKHVADAVRFLRARHVETRPAAPDKGPRKPSPQPRRSKPSR